MMTVENHIDQWLRDHLIDQDTAEKLRASLKGNDALNIVKTDTILSYVTRIGGILVGAGIFLFIGSHWNNMEPLSRIALLLILYILSLGTAFFSEHRFSSFVTESFYCIATLIATAFIFLVGQIFHLSLSWTPGFFLALIATLTTGLVRQKTLYGALSVVWILATLSSFIVTRYGVTDVEMFFKIFEIGLFPILGLSFIALATLTSRLSITMFLTPSFLRTGVFISLSAFLFSTIDSLGGSNMMRDVFLIEFPSVHYYPLLIVVTTCILLIVLSLIAGKYSSHWIKILFGIIFGYTMFLSLSSLHGVLYSLYLLHAIIIFLFIIGIISVGVLSAVPSLINTGMSFAMLFIFIQYINFSQNMNQGWITFVVGGIFLIGLSAGVDKLRRLLLRSLPSSSHA